MKDDGSYGIEPIGYALAAKYITELQDKDSVYPKISNLGGTLKAAKIKKWVKTAGFSGIMCWFCLESSGKKKKLFIALEPRYDFVYPSSDSPHELDKIQPESEKLLIPIQFFGRNPFGAGDLERKLRGHSKGYYWFDKSASRSQVNSWVGNFLRAEHFLSERRQGFGYFSAIDPKDPSDVKVNYWEQFFRPKGIRFVRFYLGYDIKCNPNTIRIILVPANFFGKNMDKDMALASSGLLQSSWPPYSENLSR